MVLPKNKIQLTRITICFDALQLLEAYSVTRTIPLVILQKKFELILEQEPKGISLDLRGAVVEGAYPVVAVHDCVLVPKIPFLF